MRGHPALASLTSTSRLENFSEQLKKPVSGICLITMQGPGSLSDKILINPVHAGMSRHSLHAIHMLVRGNRILI